MAELALLFARALGQSPQYWLNLQAGYDLKTAEAAMGKGLKAVVELVRGWRLWSSPQQLRYDSCSKNER